jgi:hypothetical protein
VSDVTEEFYDDATEAFPSVDDLAPLADKNNPTTEGRLVAIWALENGEDKGDNGMYPWTKTITLVLDDGPEGDQTTELVGPAPVRLELRHSTVGIQSRLAPRVRGVDKNDVPLRFRPMIGRVNTRPSTKYKKGSPAVSIAKPSDSDRAVVMANADLIRKINAELEQAETLGSSPDSAAFDS